MVRTNSRPSERLFIQRDFNGFQRETQFTSQKAMCELLPVMKVVATTQENIDFEFLVPE